MAEVSMGDFRAVALDFNGTLADSEHVHTKARRAAYDLLANQSGDRRFAQIHPEVHEVAHLYGSHNDEINAWILAQAGIIDDPTDLENEWVREIVSLKRQIYRQAVASGLDAIPGAPDIVRGVYEGLGNVGIATTARSYEVNPYINRHGLVDYVQESRIITREETPSGMSKPHPYVYQRIVGRDYFDVEPGEMMVVEDTPRGIEAGKRAGSFVVAVATTHGYDELSSLKGYQRPDVVFEDMTQFGNSIGVRV